MKLTNQSTGFSWGPAAVNRLCSDKNHGVWLMVAGKKQSIEIRVTNGGSLRVSSVKKLPKNEVELFGPKHQ
jgi:hypothetical protein